MTGPEKEVESDLWGDCQSKTDASLQEPRRGDRELWKLSPLPGKIPQVSRCRLGEFSMSLWFYELLNEQFGPTSEQEIRDLIELGSLSDNDRLRAADGNEWITVAEFLSLQGESAFATELSDLNFEFGESGVDASTGSRTAGVSTEPLSPEESTQADRYFCQVLGQTLGPMELHDLIPMFDGELSPTDLVRCGDDGPWRPAKSFHELIPFLHPPRTPHDASARSMADAGKAGTEELPGAEGQSRPSGVQKTPGSGESRSGTKPARPSRQKGQKKEDALIDELLNDVLMADSDPSSKPAVPRSAETHAASEFRSSSGRDSSPAVSESVASPESQPANAAPKAMASISPVPPASGRQSAKSSSKSRFSDDDFRQKLTKVVAAIAVIGIAVWAFMTFQIPGFPVSSAVRSQYVSRMKEVYTELAALDPKASDAGLERYRKIIASEFGGYLTELRKADSDDDDSVRCAVALDEFLKFSEEEFRDKADFEKRLGPLKRSLDRLN